MLRALLYAGVGAAILAGGARADTDHDVPVPEATEVLSESVSCGCTNRGAIDRGVELAVSGAAHVIPEPWAGRGYRYGTAELVGALERAAAAVAVAHPGGLLGVGDLSQDGGGALPGHRSHQSGRDADVHYYALEPDGDPMVPDGHMAVYTSTGRAYYARAPKWTRDIPERYFDLARNWAFVRAILTDDTIEVDRIFVSRRIRRWLLAYAEQRAEPDRLQQRAAEVLRPGGSAHNDHMHLRIRCSPDDITAGRCSDDPAPRRKSKYRSRIRCPR